MEESFLIVNVLITEKKTPKIYISKFFQYLKTLSFIAMFVKYIKHFFYVKNN